MLVVWNDLRISLRVCRDDYRHKMKDKHIFITVERCVGDKDAHVTDSYSLKELRLLRQLENENVAIFPFDDGNLKIHFAGKPDKKT